MAEQLGWRDAVIRVLRASQVPMHYTDIAAAIEEKGFRKVLGATPPNNVNVVISNSLRDEGARSIFERTDRGYYRIRDTSIVQIFPVS